MILWSAVNRTFVLYRLLRFSEHWIRINLVSLGHRQNSSMRFRYCIQLVIVGPKACIGSSLVVRAQLAQKSYQFLQRGSIDVLFLLVFVRSDVFLLWRNALCRRNQKAWPGKFKGWAILQAGIIRIDDVENSLLCKMSKMFRTLYNLMENNQLYALEDKGLVDWLEAECSLSETRELLLKGRARPLRVLEGPAVVQPQPATTMVLGLSKIRSPVTPQWEFF